MLKAKRVSASTLDKLASEVSQLACTEAILLSWEPLVGGPVRGGRQGELNVSVGEKKAGKKKWKTKSA